MSQKGKEIRMITSQLKQVTLSSGFLSLIRHYTLKPCCGPLSWYRGTASINTEKKHFNNFSAIQSQALSRRQEKESPKKCSQLPCFDLPFNKRPLHMKGVSPFVKHATFTQTNLSHLQFGKRSLHSQEINPNVKHHTLIYEACKDTFYYIIFLKVFLAAVGAHILLFYSRMDVDRDSNEGELSDKREGWYQKPWLHLGLQLGVFGIMLILIMPRIRYTISEIVLLPGGQGVEIKHYRLLGRARKIEVPVKYISGLQHRESESTIPLQIYKETYWLRKGTYHHPQLYDHHIGIHRKFSEED
ncbi:uncharacterized protein LOC106180821 [Lingula anatina]|uniref:Uncharacterized protein LOC106180821 n=1 Tax=Lingula anatina TaxID=7574 RepID=A0A1S3KCQ1_LINAN|nr:uncharacterized protein LOC106180821 [Lingula anatina]|eukprot:XP_013420408.1 uncharacterized protein LOC106180821 [Lingula anatina]